MSTYETPPEAASWQDAVLEKYEGLPADEQIVRLQFETVVRAMEIFHKAGPTGRESLSSVPLLFDEKLCGKVTVREQSSKPFQFTNPLEHEGDPTYMRAISGETAWFFKRRFLPARLGRLALTKTRSFNSVTFILYPGFADQADDETPILDIWKVDFPDKAPLTIDDDIGVEELFRFIPIVSHASESLNMKPGMTYDLSKPIATG